MISFQVWHSDVRDPVDIDVPRVKLTIRVLDPANNIESTSSFYLTFQEAGSLATDLQVNSLALERLSAAHEAMRA